MDYRLVVRDVETLQIQQLFSCQDAIQYIEVFERNMCLISVCLYIYIYIYMCVCVFKIYQIIYIYIFFFFKLLCELCFYPHSVVRSTPHPEDGRCAENLGFLSQFVLLWFSVSVCLSDYVFGIFFSLQVTLTVISDTNNIILCINLVIITIRQGLSRCKKTMYLINYYCETKKLIDSLSLSTVLLFVCVCKFLCSVYTFPCIQFYLVMLII